MLPRPPRRWLRIAGLLLAGLLLASCADGLTASGTPAAPPIRGRFATRTPVAPTPTPQPGAQPTGVVATSQRSVVRTYTDAQGRTITLYYGRAVGRRGDWGWAHIVGKHLKGQWSDGGPVTTFDVIGITTPEAVQEIVGRTLQEDAQPDYVANGRREYRLLVANGRYEILTVVGSDGAIITAYPDTPRRGR